MTVGLLLFLLVDGAEEELEAAGGLPAPTRAALFVLAAGAAYLVLEWVGDLLKAPPLDFARGKRRSLEKELGARVADHDRDRAP